MKKIRSLVLSVIFCCAYSGTFAQTDMADPMIIDETDQSIAVARVIPIDSVWAGHPVGFCLYSDCNRQYIAYYNSERRMVVGQKDAADEKFQLYTLPATYRESAGGTSTILGWDSHNSITLAADSEGYIHLAGNMHVDPLTYFRSAVPGDITSLEQVMKMVGAEEDRCTYPNFMFTADGDLLFHYRDGGSGNGNEIYNIYSTETREWERLLDAPLTDGQGKMNAYQSEPVLLNDGWYHVYWVWRDTPDCSTNHDLSYMKSPDLLHWFDAFGNEITLPATINDPGLIVDPIPPGGGIINLAAKMVLNDDQLPVFIYHKYDSEGNLQLYVSRLGNDKWVAKQITTWDYRWDFSGWGSIVFEVYLKDFRKRDDGMYEFSYYHKKYGNETILLDKDFNNIGKVLKPDPFGDQLTLEGNFPGLQVNIAADIGSDCNPDVKYLLKWETLTQNRDQPRPEPWPEPSRLYLYGLVDFNAE
ncbi:MAG: BNR repeat-containing protein [Bacteroidales bacterium]|nr:BNR repeat-containing protein [Bacteroidales bacterium]